MGVFKWWLPLFAMFASAAVYGGTVLDEGWKVFNLGSREGVVQTWDATDGDAEAVLYTPTDKSWLFLVKNYSSEELQKNKRYYFSAELMSNRPEKIKTVISENAEWGGMAPKTVYGGIHKPYTWEKVVIAMDRTDLDGFLSFGVGIDYLNSGAWVAVKNLSVSAEPPADMPPSTSELMIPAEIEDRDVMVIGRLMEKIERLTSGEQDPQKKAAAAADLKKLEALIAAPGGKTDNRGRACNPSSYFAEIVETGSRYSEPTISIAPVPVDFEYHAGTPVADAFSAQSMTLPVNGEDGILYLLRNNGTATETVTVTIKGDVARHAKIYQMMELNGHPDYPVEIANGGFVKVGAGETFGVLVYFRTIDAAPGTLNGEISFTTYNIQQCSAPLSLKVAEMVLPKSSVWPLKTFHWDYNDALKPDKVKMMVENKINTFHIANIPCPIPGMKTSAPDFIKRIDEVEGDLDGSYKDLIDSIRNIRAAAPDQKFALLLEVWFVRDSGGWKDEFNPWLDRLVSVLEREGLTYDDWYLEIYDETLCPEFLESCKKIKAYNPNVRIFSDYLPKDKETIDAFMPYLDVWCPLGWQYGDGFDEEIAQVENGTKGEMWLYECAPLPTTPPKYFRCMPIIAAARDLDGCCYWTTSYVPKPQSTAPGGELYGLFFRTPDNGLAPSRRWLLWQTALCDYLMFREAKADPQLKPAAEAFLNEFRKHQLDDTIGGKIRTWREANLK